MKLPELLKAYRLAERNKKRNPIRVGFELHKYRNLLNLKRDIDDRKLEASAFAYVVYRPVVREVFSAPMEVCIIDHYLDELIRANMEAWINPCVFNNRRHRGLERALDKVREDIAIVSKRYTRDCWCIVCDITGYFPNARIDYAYSLLEPLLFSGMSDLPTCNDEASELVYLLQRSLYMEHSRITRKSPLCCWSDVKPEKSIFNKPFGIGAMPGRLIMQLAMTCYHDTVIKWLMSMGIPVTVYGDDMLFVVRDKDRFLRYIMPEYRRRMADIGCQLHPRKFYCQHYTKGVRFCSQVVKVERKYAGRRTVYNFRRKVARLNRRVSSSYISRFLASVNSYTGFIKHRNSYGVLRNVLDSIDSRWFKYIRYNDARRIIEALPQYKYRNLLTRKYNIKFVHQYDTRRNRTKASQAS